MTSARRGDGGMAWLTHSRGLELRIHILPAEILMSLGMGLTFVPLSSTALIGVGPHDAAWPAPC